MSETILNSSMSAAGSSPPSSENLISKPSYSNPNVMKPSPKRILGSPFKSPNKLPNGLIFAGSEQDQSLEQSPTPTKTDNSYTSMDTIINEEDIQCPICNETMINLFQLNQHLDDTHNTVETVSNDDLTAWFKKRVSDAKKIQSNVIQQQKKFVKLDIFDNTAFTFSDSSQVSNTENNSSLDLKNKLANPVTRKHWQKPLGYGNDICNQPNCKKHLNIKNGTVNCRKCGRLFCNAHTYFRIKLSLDAEYDSNGTWCRSCESCFEEKPEFKDPPGFYQDHTDAFKAKRQVKIDEQEMTVNKLEKRFIKLINVIVQRELENHSFINRLNNLSKSQTLEQNIVQWEKDSDISNCYICLHNFGYAKRKHHCRLCGKVVCGDLETGCSMDVPAKVLYSKLDNLNYSSIVEKNAANLKDSVGIRICKCCKDSLFHKRNYQRNMNESSNKVLELYEQMVAIKQSISILLPRLENQIMKLTVNNAGREDIDEVTKLKNKLTSSFQQYEQLSKKLNLLPIHSNSERQLQANIYNSSVLFIQEKMLPLKALPKLLKDTQEKINSTVSSSTLVSESEDSMKSPPPSIQPKLMKKEIRELREQLMVMQEQSFLVREMIDSATSQRKFDEVQTLEMNLKDLENITNEIRNQLGDEGF